MKRNGKTDRTQYAKTTKCSGHGHLDRALSTASLERVMQVREPSAAVDTEGIAYVAKDL